MKIVKKKVTYLALNVETVQSSIIKVVQCRHLTNWQIDLTIYIKYM